MRLPGSAATSSWRGGGFAPRTAIAGPLGKPGVALSMSTQETPQSDDYSRHYCLRLCTAIKALGCHRYAEGDIVRSGRGCQASMVAFSITG